MKILIIGSGGREHALVWKVAQSPLVTKVYCAPGNAGIAMLAECVPLQVQDVTGLLQFAIKNQIDLTIVGPELPLSLGIVDEFEKAGLKIFGPQKNAAVVEASKVFSKDFCKKYQIPTAPYQVFTAASDAKKYLQTQNKYPTVIKADGLAAGKGVIVAKNEIDAFAAIDDMLLHNKFGASGAQIVIEDFMPGEEATFMVLTDGKNFVPLETSQDHKRAYDNDEGPNTGGMGAYSPAPIVTADVHNTVCEKIIKPFLVGMEKEGRPYRGILYAGLMIANNEPRIVEFNCRFGDPEAEVILYRMKSDLVAVILKALKGELTINDVEFDKNPAVSVVICSKGYPGTYENGKMIQGLTKAAQVNEAIVFHSGTKQEKENIVTNGGRVLTVTAKGATLSDAIKKVYSAVELISWEGAFYRTDIGRRGIK